jgi:serine-type D-Ala-D-Ala carboxypeptidase (penicillin-binding protein 5/6)
VQPREDLVASIGPVPIPLPRQYEIKPVQATKVEAADETQDGSTDTATSSDASENDEAAADNMSSDPQTLWQVQIAAVPSEDAARGLLEKARGKAGRSLNGAMNYTQSAGGGIYRARFIGFANRDMAENACRTLKAKSFSCMVISGNG